MNVGEVILATEILKIYMHHSIYGCDAWVMSQNVLLWIFNIFGVRK